MIFMTIDLKKDVPSISAVRVAKLKVNMKNHLNQKFGTYDLDFKDISTLKYITVVTFKDLSLYRDDERTELVQTIKCNRIKKLLECPNCMKQERRLYIHGIDTGNEIFVCSDCHEYLEKTNKQM